ncbi:MAG: aminotransferase class I/II-fold pyridoxal phosphate-dependent enzyme [Anaerolineae bacterium]|nr:aminotransferase class I/II-fold pyridoxal phosphate-dependent enzyme [Anaerolineae bacterium]
MTEHKTDKSKTWGPDTIAIHIDKALNETTSLAPPIYQTSTFVARTADEFTTMANEPQHPRFYTRYGNPTHEQAQAVIAALEGADKALMTSSGMGAVSAIVFALLEQGSHVVAQRVHYGGSLGILENVLSKFGVETTFVDQTDPGAFAAAIRPNTRLILTETPTNPLMLLTDLKAVAALGKEHGIITVTDNTFATPINQRPLDLGIDLVFHSATKYFGGHHDLVAGAVAGNAALIERVWRMSIALGVTLNAFDSWLLLRGLRTLRLRVEQHNTNTLAVARMLAAHPKVRQVYYPGLEDHPQHALACAQMSGFTGMLSFELDGDFAATERFIAHLDLIERAASLGGIHTLIVHPAAMMAAVMSGEEFAKRGIKPSLVRLSVGLENEQDIMADLRAALDAV